MDEVVEDEEEGAALVGREERCEQRELQAGRTRQSQPSLSGVMLDC